MNNPNPNMSQPQLHHDQHQNSPSSYKTLSSIIKNIKARIKAKIKSKTKEMYVSFDACEDVGGG